MKRIFTAFMMMLCAACVASAANYLTFTAEEDSSTFGIMNEKNNPDVQYSLDGGETWTALAAGDTITLAHKGDKALLRGDNPEGFSKSRDQYSTFRMTGKVSASGSVMSLIDGTGLSTEIPKGYCFCRSFRSCTSLTRAPELPATTLTAFCYDAMFLGCTSLTEAPELPATTLANFCYDGMFDGCTSLTQAPKLSATTLAEGCNDSMFSGCTRLSEIHVSFDDWNDDYSIADWVYNVAPTGTFYCPKALPLEYGVDRIPEGWTVKYIDDTVAVETNYLTFTAEEDGSSFGIVNNGSNNPDVQYSLDGGATWIALAEGDTVILAHKGDKALLRGNNPEGFSKSWEQYSTFKMTGKVAASGSVMSLIDGVGLSTEISKSFCFYRLFSGCTSLTQAPELPAKTLAYYCYNSMFEGCTSLTQAPELPATEMTFYCYNRMFSGCTSLTQAPELPATTLFENCYSGMFSGCTSLTRAPELPAIKMFSYCYSGMFSGCTSLTQAPELPAKEFLGKYSYSGMFSGCTSLSEINVSFDDWDKFDATFEWVAVVAPTGTFICPKDLPLEYGWARIPEGWTVKYIDDTVAVETNYLTFTAEEDGSTFGIINEGGNNPDVQYSLDGGETWTALAAGDTITLAHKGDKALLRGNNPNGFSRFLSPWTMYTSFTMTGKIAASGSVMSLIDGIGETLVIPNDFCFYKLFFGCASLTEAPELPAAILRESCYWEMFVGCTSLTEAPELPATTLTYRCYREMFSGCTSLTQAPELPATTLATSCYYFMFDGCTGLTEAPELPATTLAGYCYYGMFSGCTGLTQAPVLPATTLAGYCYWRMFQDCASLTQAPELPATTLAEGCCASMFSGCTSLTQAPELPATTLADDCYSFMFSGCTGLAQAPELPATTMAVHCYEYMFYGCTSLTKAPELPATELPDSLFMRSGCCESMFSGCTNLSEISVAFDKWNDNTRNWVENVSPTATFICPKDLPLEHGVDRIPEGWTVKYIEDMANYLTFTAEEDGSSFGIVNNGGNNPDVRYSLDGGETWTALAGGKMVTLAHKGDKALLKGNNPQGFSKDYDHYSAFKMIGKVAASGSVMSLIDETDLSTEIPNGYCFCRLFRNCTSLTQAPELPATTLASGCYYEMFSNCTSLTQAPELPTTTLANNCYYGMFSDCTSLTQAPELPATTLAEACYYSMFSRCTSLVQAPELPTTTLADYCYCFMFSGCTSLAQAPTLSSMVMVEGCYSYMFSGCTSLTQAPELPATTLPTVIECGCYQGMFSRCTSLTQAPELPATTLANFCYREMFSGCANLTQAPELPATELVFACYESMFSGCTSLTQAPALPATTLADFCYDAMFRGCTSLSQIRVSFDDWNDGLHTDRWVADVAPTGTFICPKTLALEYGEDRIPEGWTVKYIGEEGSGVSSALADDITVWTDGLTVYVCGVEGEVSLYDMSGRIVAVSNSADEERALCVPAKGAYVVRANGGSSVVLVR